MKKVFNLFALIIVLAMVLSACASPQAAPEEPAAEEAADAPAEEVVEEEAVEDVTIRVLVRPDEGGNVAMFAEKFTEETGIKVEVDFVGWGEIYNKIVTTLASGGGGYDIVFVPSANAQEFAPSFEAIDDLIAGEEEKWLAPVVGLYTFEDHLFAMPWYSGGAHMAYNKEILDAAGVDAASIKTWDDFVAACQAVQETEAADFCFSPSAKYPGNFFFNWGGMVLGLGGQLFDAEGTPVFQETDAVVKSFEMLQSGVADGYFDPAGVAMDDYETLIEFGAGTTAMLLDSTWAATQANRNEELSQVTGKVGYLLIPGSEGIESSGFLYAGGLGLLKESENKDAAKQFLKYLTSEEAQKHHAIEGANLPTRVVLFGDEEIAEKWDGYAELSAQLEYGQFAPQFSWFEEWRRQAAAATQDIMNGDKTPQEAADWLLEETERLRSE
ncbi:MAG: sugar ABC transporter substrate-binding protein [Anaerolineaceae bacterium]|nr:sugar ABC transporter substrate-binding protein [Anaerolineaceae bacterium]